MRAPRDVTEGSGVGLQREDGGVTPLGEQLTLFSHRQLSPQPKAGSPSCLSLICSVSVPGVPAVCQTLPWAPGAGNELSAPTLEAKWGQAVRTAALGTHEPGVALPSELKSHHIPLTAVTADDTEIR